MSLNPNTVQDRVANMLKSFDPSHGGHLHQTMVTTKAGVVTKKWIADKKVNSTEQWWSKYKEYKLNAYPVNIPESEVQINDKGDINSHWVLRWTDPKTQQTKSAYSKEFLDRNAQQKWARIQNLSSAQVEIIKKKSLALLVDATQDTSIRDAAAVISIIANTGLRRGNKLKFNITGNRGVSTLSSENIKVEGSKVKFNFTGKSYKDNVATVKNLKLANYLKERQTENKDNQWLFETNDAAIDKVFDNVGGQGLKIKDMRTYVATDLARKILFDDPAPPPPLPENLSKSKQKKLVQTKLKEVYERVSQVLNNTPAMAKSSYVHPYVIETWVKKLGLNFDLVKSNLRTQSGIMESLDYIKKLYPAGSTMSSVELSANDEDECDFFNLPDWWDNTSEVEKAFDDLFKGGEGSKGGKVIGHTQSGKPIYASGKKFEKYSYQDHHDAFTNHAAIADSWREREKHYGKQEKEVKRETRSKHFQIAIEHKRNRDKDMERGDVREFTDKDGGKTKVTHQGATIKEEYFDKE